MHRGRRAHQQFRNPHVALLFAQLAARVLQLEYKPPVTLVLVAVNLFLFYGDLRELLPPKHLHRLLDGAMQPRLILQGGQWWRLVSSAFLHLDEWHIYYNMSSLVWKGVQLERRYGSKLFAALVAELLLLSHGMYVVITVLLSYQIPDYRYLYRDTRVAGFSAVLFALKVVLAHHPPDYSEFMGITLPTKYACWAELFLASYLSPHVSFLGHLAGILAGLVHVRALEPAAGRAQEQIRRWYVRWVNASRRRAMPRDGGRRLGGGGGGGGGDGVVGRTAGDAAHPDPRPAAAARSGGQVLGGGGGGRYGDGGGSGVGGWGAAAQRTGYGTEPRRPGAAEEGSGSEEYDDDGGAGCTAGGGGGGTTPDEMRRKRLERLDGAAQAAARSRSGLSTARRTGGQPQRTAAADPSLQGTGNRRYFNCGGTLGGGDVDGAAPRPQVGVVAAPSSGSSAAAAARSEPAGGTPVGGGGGGGGQQRTGGPAPAEGTADDGGSSGRGGGTTSLTDEELRRRRLDWLERPRRG